MKYKNIIRFASSFIILPFVTIPVIPDLNMEIENNILAVKQNVLSLQTNKELFPLIPINEGEEDKAIKEQQLKASSIDAFYRFGDMPLEGKGLKMVQEAENNNLDWRLLAAISVIETTGGKNLCKNPSAPNNPFGWGSCKIGFKSIDEAIEVVGMNLGGGNPKTEKYYKDKDLRGILYSYNSVIPTYYQKINWIMDKIEAEYNTLKMQEVLELASSVE